MAVDLGLLMQHVVLVALSTIAAVAIGVPVGVLAARRPRLGAPIVWAANVVQTIPSLAMFGFLSVLSFAFVRSSYNAEGALPFGPMQVRLVVDVSAVREA